MAEPLWLQALRVFPGRQPALADAPRMMMAGGMSIDDPRENARALEGAMSRRAQMDSAAASADDARRMERERAMAWARESGDTRGARLLEMGWSPLMAGVRRPDAVQRPIQETRPASEHWRPLEDPEHEYVMQMAATLAAKKEAAWRRDVLEPELARRCRSRAPGRDGGQHGKNYQGACVRASWSRRDGIAATGGGTAWNQ